MKGAIFTLSRVAAEKSHCFLSTSAHTGRQSFSWVAVEKGLCFLSAPAQTKIFCSSNLFAKGQPSNCLSMQTPEEETGPSTFRLLQTDTGNPSAPTEMAIIEFPMPAEALLPWEGRPWLTPWKQWLLQPWRVLCPHIPGAPSPPLQPGPHQHPPVEGCPFYRKASPGAMSLPPPFAVGAVCPIPGVVCPKQQLSIQLVPFCYQVQR